MACKAWGSDRLSVSSGEIAILLPGGEGPTKPIVWLFPKLLLCLNCGVAELAIPDTELSVLAESSPPAAVCASQWNEISTS
jgi:hypothetical protein